MHPIEQLINELAHVEATPVLSVYLDTDLSTGRWEEKRYLLDRTMDAAAERAPTTSLATLARTQHSLSELLDSYKPQGKALAIFVSLDLGLWRTVHLDVPVRTKVHIDVVPDIVPLVEALSTQRPHAVALVDNAQGRTFLVQMGTVVKTQAIKDRVPGRHKQIEHNPRIERRHAVKVREHLDHVAQVLTAWVADPGFSALIVGGTPEPLAKFKQYLPDGLSSLIVGEVSVPMYASDAEVVHQAAAAVEASRLRREQAMAQELITRAAKHDGAIVGADATLGALRQRQVHEIIVGESLSLKGYRCPRCGYLTTIPTQSCPFCGTPLEAVQDVVVWLSRLACVAGLNISVLHGAARERLQEVGGIGAYLKIPDSKSADREWTKG